jgi:hypothetical protein
MTNSVLQKATEHFRSRLDGSLRSIEVPEWNTTVYYYPTSTLKDESTILKLQQEGKTVDALVQSLIVKARTAEGHRMFTVADRITLLNEVDPQIVIRIASALNGVDTDSVEDIEKN